METAFSRHRATFLHAPAGLTLICGDLSHVKTLLALNVLGSLADRDSGLIVTNSLTRNELKKRIHELVNGPIALRAILARDEVLYTEPATLPDAIEHLKERPADVLLVDGCFQSLPDLQNDGERLALVRLMAERPAMVVLMTAWMMKPDLGHWLCRMASTALLVRSHKQRVMAVCLKDPMGRTGTILNYGVEGFSLVP